MQEEAKSVKQSQVTEQLNNLDGGIANLHETINALVSRLEFVLRKEPPTEQCAGKDKTEIVPLARILEDHADSVRAAKDKINNILDRLEL